MNMNKTLKFVSKANLIHNNFYDYSKTVYTKSNELVIILCPLHGSFQKTPHMHITFKVGCPTCSKEKSRIMTTDTFIIKANKKHSNKFDYSLSIYKGTFEKIIIKCSNGHTFEQRANDHLTGSGCPFCSNKAGFSFKTFKKDASLIHNNFYIYPDQEIDFKKDTVLIRCPLHGDFEQIARNHLKGYGCTLCGYTYSGWSKTTFKKKCDKNNHGLGTLYVIKCFNEKEEFYKRGITSHSVIHRYRDTTRMPYKYEVINEVQGNAENIYELETKLKLVLKDFRYIPSVSFGGSLTECFKIPQLS